MKRRLGGAPRGKGAIYEWDGNSNVGKGRMEIAASTPPSKITIDIKFEEPFEARNVAEFTMQPEGDSTNVTWTMRGRAPYVAKVFGVFVSMDSMIGKDFEIGLANLKQVAEKATAAAPPPTVRR